MTSAEPARRFRLLPPNKTLGWVPYAWLIYLAAFYIDPIVGNWGPGYWALTIVGTIAFLASYFRAHWERGRRLLPIIAFQTALGIGFSFINSGSGVFFVYAAAAAGTLDRQRDAVRIILLIAAIGTATAWLIDAPPYFWISPLVFAPLIGGVNLHFHQVGRANAKLHMAQQEIEHLATVAERERIARDLHDVLGHTLSLIILKSELAAKLSERDPQRAGKEIRDVEQVARKALGEVREAIRGYRATLDDEIARARSLLDAAGVRSEFAIELGTPDPGRDEALAFVLREAATNIVRHSGASVCRVRAEQSPRGYTLTVEDDGGGGVIREGSGIRGMRERLEELGGALAYDGSRGMRLTATIPLGKSRTVADPVRRAAAGRDAG